MQQMLISQSRSPDRRQTNRIPGVVSRSSIRVNDRCFSWRQFGHFAKECSEKDTSSDNIYNLENQITKHKGFSHPYEEVHADEVTAAVYHNGEQTRWKSTLNS